MVCDFLGLQGDRCLLKVQIVKPHKYTEGFQGILRFSGNKVCLSENKTRYKLLYLYNTEAGLRNKTESDQEFGLAWVLISNKVNINRRVTVSCDEGGDATKRLS